MAAVFTLAPALRDAGVIDYSTTHGTKLYQSATRPLSKDTTFDYEPGTLNAFLSSIKARASIMGWNDVLLVPKDMANPHIDLVDLVTNYGEVRIEQVHDHAVTYVNGCNRAAQDSSQLFNCILSSLSSEGISKISVWEDEYLVNQVGSGALLLKTIIWETDIDTNATVRSVRHKLSNLDTYLPTIDHDIMKFNLHVKNLVAELNARGETTQDLLVNLFKGYNTAPDKSFLGYIQKKEDDYDDGADINPNELMKLAANKYKVLVDKNVWNAPTAQEEKIVALEATIKKLTKEKKPKRKKTIDFKRKKKPEWMLKPPKETEKDTPKTVNDNEYWWCPTHKAWTRHSPSDCKRISYKKPFHKQKKPKEGKDESSPSNQEETPIEAAQAMTDASDLEYDLQDDINFDLRE